MPREATAVERRSLTLRILGIEHRSHRQPPFEWLELHLVPPRRVTWELAVADLAAIGTRIREMLPTTVYDLDGRAPEGTGPCAIRADNLTIDEIVQLKDRKWSLVEARRIATVDGVLGGDETHERRIAVARERAGKRAWNYYRSSRWAFIYPMRPARPR